mgnify:CR=1 FL=1|jgi:hypothetical protein
MKIDKKGGVKVQVKVQLFTIGDQNVYRGTRLTLDSIQIT